MRARALVLCAVATGAVAQRYASAGTNPVDSAATLAITRPHLPPGSPSEGLLSVGDEIMTVNDRDVSSMSHEGCLALITAHATTKGSVITFGVKSRVPARR